jgi:hypothetical protein
MRQGERVEWKLKISQQVQNYIVGILTEKILAARSTYTKPAIQKPCQFIAIYAKK